MGIWLGEGKSPLSSSASLGPFSQNVSSAATTEGHAT